MTSFPFYEPPESLELLPLNSTASISANYPSSVSFIEPIGRVQHSSSYLYDHGNDSSTHCTTLYRKLFVIYPEDISARKDFFVADRA